MCRNDRSYFQKKTPRFRAESTDESMILLKSETDTIEERASSRGVESLSCRPIVPND